MYTQTVPSKLAPAIDAKNLTFTSEMKGRLERLADFSDQALEWLMVEHYQFSFRNPEFLATAAKTSEQLDDPAIAQELDRNYNEEKSHAQMYKRALLEIGTDVDKRVEFPPTTQFLSNIHELISGSATVAVGAMYATETAAIFEHEVFWDISREVVTRRGYDWERTKLKAFHDMHLAGVEQSHKDGLAGFVDPPQQTPATREETLLGANRAIESMVTWWNALLARCQNQ